MRPAFVIGVLVMQLMVSAAAWGAQPVPGARYVLPLSGNEGTPRHEGVLQITDDGRALTSTPHVPFSPLGHGMSASYLGVKLSCGGGYLDTIYFGIGAPGFAVARIGRRGTFAAIGRGNLLEGYPTYDYWVRLRGRFVSTGRAVVEIVDGRYSPGGRRCRIPHRTFSFKRAPSPPFSGCSTAPGQMLAAAPASRVFRDWGEDSRGRAEYAYACMFGGSPIALGRLENLSAFSLAGSYVAYAQREVAPDDDATWWYLDVVDLRGGGRVVHTANTPIPDYTEATALTDLWSTFAASAVTPLGSVAWIAYYCTEERDGICTKDGYDVWVWDAAGNRRVDRGTGIDPKSLSFQDGSITWTNDGVTKQAPIDAAPAAAI